MVWEMVKTEKQTLIKKYRLSKFSKKPLYNVVLLNDDYTPMDFVVEIIQNFFYKDFESATQLMLRIHRQGRAICGIYNRQIAETKVTMVNSYARSHEYPLLCIMEKAEIH